MATLRDNRQPPTPWSLTSRWRSRKWLALPPLAAGLLIVVLVMRARSEIPRVEIAERSTRVSVMTASRGDVPISMTGYGTATPSRSWTAIAEVSGRIVSIHPALKSGQRVEAGETLLTIDDRDYRLRLAQRNAELDSATASLDELFASEAADQRLLNIEESLLVVTQRDVDRQQELQTRSAASKYQLDQAQSNLLKQTQSVQRLKNSLLLYPSRIAAARAKVALSEAAVQEAARNVERTVITSPLCGVLSGVDLQTGQVVTANQQLFDVQDSECLEVVAQVSLSQLNLLLPGGSQNERAIWSDIRAEVTTESGAEQFSWPGRPVRLTEAIDEQTRTIGIVVEVVNPSGDRLTSRKDTQPRTASLTDSLSDSITESISAMHTPSGTRAMSHRLPLKPGTYCEVRLSAPALPGCITVPNTSFDGDSIYVVDADDRLRGRPVIRGRTIDDVVIVRSGIEVGDQVVIRPPVPAIEGMLVRRP